jgi:DNA-binding XRE family transcriptional regulator
MFGPLRNSSSLIFGFFIDTASIYLEIREQVKRDLYRHDISMRVYAFPDMPPSVQKHNLARLRNALSLTQAELAELISRKEITVRSIETGKLALSPKLATLIAEATGADRDWLLKNDLNADMPPLKRGFQFLGIKQKAYVANLFLIMHLIHRLVTVLMHFDRRPGSVPQIAHGFIADELKRLKKNPAPDFKADLSHLVSLGIVEMFKAHPEMLEPDLRRLINLDYLSKDLEFRKQLKGGRSPQAQIEDWKVTEEDFLIETADVELLLPPRKSRSRARSKP